MTDITETEEMAPAPKKRRTKKKAAKVAPKEGLEMAVRTAQFADEKLGDDIVLLDVSELTSYTSFILLVTAKSSRQTGSLGSYFEDLFLTEFGQKSMSREGIEGSGWLLLDFGDIIIHIFTEEERQRYDLEGFWKDAPRIDFAKAK